MAKKITKPKSIIWDDWFNDDDPRAEHEKGRVRGGKKWPTPSNSPEAKAQRLQQFKKLEKFRYEQRYEFSKPQKSEGQGTGKVRGQYRQNILSPGRAQPKGTMPRPPRTGPGSGVGGVGLGSRWSRLTGGIRFGSK